MNTLFLKRNTVPYNDYETMINSVNDPTFFDKFSPRLNDGEMLLLRYNEDGKVKTNVAIVYVNGSTKSITLKENTSLTWGGEW